MCEKEKTYEDLPTPNGRLSTRKSRFRKLFVRFSLRRGLSLTSAKKWDTNKKAEGPNGTAEPEGDE